MVGLSTKSSLGSSCVSQCKEAHWFALVRQFPVTSPDHRSTSENLLGGRHNHMPATYFFSSFFWSSGCLEAEIRQGAHDSRFALEHLPPQANWNPDNGCPGLCRGQLAVDHVPKIWWCWHCWHCWFRGLEVETEAESSCPACDSALPTLTALRSTYSLLNKRE